MIISLLDYCLKFRKCNIFLTIDYSCKEVVDKVLLHSLEMTIINKARILIRSTVRYLEFYKLLYW